MAKEKELTPKRYTISCKKCPKKWKSDNLDTCECGSAYLFVNDRVTLKSRNYLNGVMIES